MRRIKTINKWKKPCHTFFLLPFYCQLSLSPMQDAPKMCLIGERIQRLGLGGGAPRISNRGSGRLSDWRLAINCLGSDISISCLHLHLHTILASSSSQNPSIHPPLSDNLLHSHLQIYSYQNVNNPANTFPSLLIDPSIPSSRRRQTPIPV